jgi:quinol monooxygenase YgiN
MAKHKKRKSTPKRGKARSGTRRPGKPRADKLPKDAVVLVVVMRAKPGQEFLLEAELRALVHPTRKEDGCFRYDLYCSADAPGAYMFYEIWASREHHRRHTQTPHFLRWNARKDALIASRESAFWKQIA